MNNSNAVNNITITTHPLVNITALPNLRVSNTRHCISRIRVYRSGSSYSLGFMCSWISDVVTAVRRGMTNPLLSIVSESRLMRAVTVGATCKAHRHAVDECIQNTEMIEIEFIVLRN
jgi:hypothetical protein